MATARAQRTLTSRCAPVCASSPRPRRKAAATRRECTSAPSDAAERLAALARKAGVALSGAVISAVLLTTSPQVRAARRAGAAIALRAPRLHPSAKYVAGDLVTTPPQGFGTKFRALRRRSDPV